MSTAWLRDLEEKVQETAARLSELQQENKELTARVSELEAQLEAAPDAEDASAWSEEREDIRERVEKLVEHLSDLLESE